MYVYSLTFLTFLFHERTSKLIKHYRESRIDEATYPTNEALLRFSHYLTTRSIWLATKRLLIWILSNDEMTKFAIIENYLRTRAKHNRTGRGNLLEIFESFVNHRTQRVRVIFPSHCPLHVLVAPRELRGFIHIDSS